jgi:putative nucleotidyltransferase with HDIG domain
MGKEYPDDVNERTRYILETFPVVSMINDGELRGRVVEVYWRVMDLAGCDDLNEVPFTKTYETDVRYPEHIKAVTNLALGAAIDLREAGIEVDEDILIAGALLHDVGKILEYSKEDSKYCGSMVKHNFTGAAIAQEVGLPPAVLHCIIYHSYEGDGRRRSVESIIVHHCDFIHFESIRAKDNP